MSDSYASIGRVTVEPETVHVFIRDGRFGRDESEDPTGYPVITEMELSGDDFGRYFDGIKAERYELLGLPDGETVVVFGWRLNDAGFTFYVGDHLAGGTES